MSDKPGFSDVQPAKHLLRLIYCSNCGQKQDRSNQKYCSNCGSSFYPEQKPSHNEEIEEPEQYDEVGENIHSSNLNSIGGWLILPYIGFYLTAIVSIFYIFSSYSKPTLLSFSYLLMYVLSITCIIKIHTRNKSFRNYVYTLYTVGVLQMVYISYETRNIATFIVGGIGYGIWIAYFTESKRVEALIGSKA